jgi:excisionase family DNA binding protein
MSKERNGGDRGCRNFGNGQDEDTLAPVVADRLLRIEEAAEVLAISARALYRLIAAGKLPPPVKIGSATRIPESDLMQYINALKDARQGGAK